MANTITSKLVSVSTKEAVLYITLASDGTQETGTVIYDSSVVATSAGDTDPLTSSILEIYASVSAASTARVKLLWDASSTVLAMNIPVGIISSSIAFDEKIGGLPNQAGSGITGDILLTTTGLASGDAITMVLRIKRR